MDQIIRSDMVVILKEWIFARMSGPKDPSNNVWLNGFNCGG